MRVRNLINIARDEIGGRDGSPKSISKDSDGTNVFCHGTHSTHGGAGFEESGEDGGDADEEDTGCVVVVLV